MRDCDFYFGHGIEISHELGCELGVAVTDGFSRKPEPGPNMVSIDTCCTKGREFHIGGEGYDVFGELVDYDNDCILVIGEWSDKIDRDVFPWCIWDCVWM